MERISAPRKKLTLTTQIFIGLAVGLAVGAIVHETGDHPTIIAWIRVISRIFLNLIKVIIGPLIFSTLVVGIAGAGNLKSVGRIGIKAFIYFEIVTTIALTVGLFAVNLTRPGDGINLAVENGAKHSVGVAKVDTGAEPSTKPTEATATPARPRSSGDEEARELAARAKKITPQDHVVNIVPTSIIKSMAENDVLQIVVFSLIFAIGVAACGAKGKPMLEICASLSEVMFKFTNYVMMLAPYGVGAALAVTVGTKGLGVIKNLAMLILTLYGALAVFIVVVLGLVALIIRLPMRRFLTLVREPCLLAFATTSSESAFPKALENMEKLGVPRRIASFVLPMGYSFNLDGSTLYLSLAAVFVAQAANVELTVWQQILMLLTLMLTTKGIAAVPRASLVVLSGTLVTFGLPIEGVAIILGVDELMDMARTATNVLGNCLATAVVAKWEGEFDPKASEKASASPREAT